MPKHDHHVSPRHKPKILDVDSGQLDTFIYVCIVHTTLYHDSSDQREYFNEERLRLQRAQVREMTLPDAGHVDTGVSSPGVQTSATGTFSPLLSVSIAAADGSIHSPLDAGSYASADAARVGGGLYKHLLQAACTLATDPAPKVARLGKAALRVADVELAPVSVNAGLFSVGPHTCSAFAVHHMQLPSKLEANNTQQKLQA